ncbi:MAG: oxygen-independent coproporphyrinogen III oxidase [Gammaproteobacteria bacterium]
MDNTLIFNKDLITRYDKSGPRYTSYPTAVQMHEGFNSAHYMEVAKRTNEDPVPSPLSLYFHIPFCSTVCYYCACNKIITRNRGHAAPYLDDLHKEIALQGTLFDKDRTVNQLHWGGGTPTFISQEQMRELMQEIRRHFSLRDDDNGEYSIELDPREADDDTMALLRSLGFNRVSLGVQDFDPEVQKAVNRIQSEEETLAIIEAARREGFKSVSLDLIYGLPKQNVENFSQTLKKVIVMGPDRLSVFNYAHMPDRFKVQNQINASDLPGPEEKLEILQHNINLLTDAGYIYIGMDHFAKPDDELALAQQNGTLYRNFQGYSTHADCDLVGMGITAISKIGDCYAQNVHSIDDYGKYIGEGTIPINRGIKLDSDDLLRRDVITQLICHFKLEFGVIEDKYRINFTDYFYNELQALKVMQEDGLLTMDMEWIRISPAGRLLIRNICAVFDKYLRQAQSEQIFSRVI